MREAISAAILTELSCELNNDELAAAVRLLSRLCETGRPIALRMAHISAGCESQTWEIIKPQVLSFFKIQDDALTLPEHAIIEDSEEPLVSLKERQGELNLHVRSARRPTVPQYAIEDKPQPVSIRSALWNNALVLFKNAGMSEKTARSMLAALLKKYSEGDVAMAVSDACKKDCLAEPHTWILGRLKAQDKRRSAAAQTGPKPANPARIATPERMGISNQRAEKIRSRNAALKIKADQ